MANVLKQGELFVKETLARLKGDDAEVLAVKNSRKAIAAISGQLSALNFKKLELEGSVDTAKEGLLEAKFPTTPITSSQSYCEGISIAQENLDMAEDNLKELEEAITYFEAVLAKY